jgi:hypothetical protein
MLSDKIYLTIYLPEMKSLNSTDLLNPVGSYQVTTWYEEKGVAIQGQRDGLSPRPSVSHGSGTVLLSLSIRSKTDLVTISKRLNSRDRIVEDETLLVG